MTSHTGGKQPPDFRETLYTIDRRGRRKWVYASVSRGRFFQRRAFVAFLLICFYLLMPWISVGGHQAIWLDIVHRRFTVFGATFWATDTTFLFLVLASLGFCLFFFTSLFGRVWCGWACPETVFLEFIFRPLERIVLGGPVERRRFDEAPWSFTKAGRKLLLWGIYGAVAWVLATTFLAYFLGSDRVLQMIVHSPGQNPIPFVFSMAFIGLVFFQFTWFREQFCTVLCPYARFQSVLMDRDSLTVGYDARRGEPRGKAKAGDANFVGDCVDCGLCQRVCPTGIDIRNGLQLECVACTQCVDACDSVMDKLGRPRGLIRYATEAELTTGAPQRFIRPRVAVYSAILLVIFSVFGYRLMHRSLTDVQIIRGSLDVPFTRGPDDSIMNHLTLKVANKNSVPESYTVESRTEGVGLVVPGGALSLAAGEVRTVPIFLKFPAALAPQGKLSVSVLVASASGWQQSLTVSALGPEGR